MSATKLNVEWQQDIWELAENLVIDCRVRQIAQPSRDLRCPKCHSIIYTRRHPWCSVCGDELPEALRFSPSEAQRVKQIVASERQRHRIWLNREWSK